MSDRQCNTKLKIKFYKFYRSSRNANVCVQTSDKLAKIFILVFQKVRGTNIKDMDTSADQGEGLFVTCDIKKGELISFYSGHMVHHSGPHSLHRRKISDSLKIYQQKYDLIHNRLILSSDWEWALECPRRWQLLEIEIEME